MRELAFKTCCFNFGIFGCEPMAISYGFGGVLQGQERLGIMLDPITAGILANFALGIAQNCIVGAVTEWKKLRDDERARQNSEYLADYEHHKNLTSRVSQKITESFRNLSLTKCDAELLLPLANDQLLSDELARQIVASSYTARTITDLMIANQPALALREQAVLEFAAAVVEGIRNAIASDEHLYRVRSLQFQEQTTDTLVDMRGEMRAHTLAQNAQNALMAQLIQQVGALTTLKSSNAEGDAVAEHLKTSNQKRFDRALAGLLRGSIVTAEKEFRDVVSDLESQGNFADKHLLFRAYTNLGSSLWQQFRRSEAIPYFEKASEIKPEDLKAKTNKALCYVEKGDFPLARSLLDEARAANPNSFDPIYLLSSLSLEEGNAPAAIRILKERAFETDDYYSALAFAYLRNNEYAGAENAARRALAIDADCLQAQIALAHSLGFPLIEARLRPGAESIGLTEAEHSQILEAIRTAEGVIQTLRKQARSHQLGEVLANLSAFYGLGNDHDKALSAAAEAATLVTDDAAVLINLWAAQMRLEKFSDAYETAGRLIQFGEKLQGKLRQLEALLMDSQAERLLRESEADPEVLGQLRREPRFFELRANAFFQSHETNIALDVIKEGLAAFPNHGRLLTARACFLEDLGQIDSAREDIENAEKAASADNLAYVLAQAAMFFYRQRQWQAAIERFSRGGADSIYSPFLEVYLTCLHNARNYSLCFELSTAAIRAKAKFDPMLYELAARSAYNSDNLKAAEHYLDQLVRRTTGDGVQHQAMLAQVYLRLDEPGKAYDVLKKAHAHKRQDLNILIGLSFVETLRKEHKEAFRHAQEAVKAAPDDVRAHLALVRASLSTPVEMNVEPTQQKTFQASFEFLQNHPSGYIKAIPFEKDLKSFIRLAKARADHARMIESLVSKRRLPMGFLANALGVSAFKAWRGLVPHPKLHVSMAYGTSEEQERETAEAGSAEAVCVDAFALITLRLLNRLDLLPRVFRKVIVHTSTLESFVSDLRDNEIRKPALTVSYVDGKLARSEMSAEDVALWFAFLQDVRNFLKGPGVELASLDRTVPMTEEMRQAIEILGSAYYDPILLAQNLNVAFYCDDAPMRSLASIEHHIPTFCTQAVLRVARGRGLLSDAEYEDCIIELLRHNYHFVSESADTILRLAESEQFQLTLLSRRLLNRLSQPELNQSFSVKILGEFFVLLWRSDFTKSGGRRDEWLGVCIEALFKPDLPGSLVIEFLLFMALRSQHNPDLFWGATRWVLSSGKLALPERTFFYACSQTVIEQMSKLMAQQYPWWRSLAEQWRYLARMNHMLERNGWLWPSEP